MEGLYYPCSENKGADQLRGDREAGLRLCVTAELVCVFVFAYAKNRFSHDAAPLYKTRQGVHVQSTLIK